MKPKKTAAVAIVSAGIMLTACGDDGGGNTGDFSDRVQDACRAVDRELGDLDQPSRAAEFDDAASRASRIIEAGVAELKRLAPPDELADEAAQLIGNLEDQLDLLDQLSAAARQGDDATISAKITALDRITAANGELAESLDANRCAFDPIFASGPVPSTTPPTTAPPTTAPPTTIPPTTAPPTTAPPTTAPPAGSTKRPTPRAGAFTPSGDFTFSDVDSIVLETWIFLLDLSPVVEPQPGEATGLDITAGGGTAIGQAFLFVADAPLVDGSIDDLLTVLNPGGTPIPDSIAGLDGQSYVDSEGTNYFIAGDESVILWALASTREQLEETVLALQTS